MALLQSAGKNKRWFINSRTIKPYLLVCAMGVIVYGFVITRHYHTVNAKHSNINNVLICNKGKIYTINKWLFPASTKRLHNICTTSAQRLRRWSNIVQMLYKCFVFTGLYITAHNYIDKVMEVAIKKIICSHYM